MDEKEFRKNINISNALKLISIAYILIIASILTYVRAIILWWTFDFGIIFEIISLVFLIISHYFIANNDDKNAKKIIIATIVPVAWLMIYDIIFLILTSKTIIDIFLLNGVFILDEFLLLGFVYILSNIYKKLSKIEEPKKFEEKTDWFYEKYDENKKN